MRENIKKQILEALDELPELDCFADQETHLFHRWWGEGGEFPDAFDKNWAFDKVGTLWANPPFSKLPQVVEKVRRDGARMILVCPDWQRDLWWKDLQDMVVDKMLFPRGQKIFRAPDRSLGGTK